MKTFDDLISQIPIDKANLDHISKSGKINGSLLASMKIVLKIACEQAIDDYARELLLTNDSIIAKSDKVKQRLR